MLQLIDPPAGYSRASGITTSSPLNTLKGRIPAWNVQQFVSKPDAIKYPQAKKLTKKEKVDTIEAANVKAAVDARLVTIQQTAVHKPTPEENKFAKFDKVTDYQTVNTYEIGGRTILSRLSFSVEAAETLVLLGRSGSGKTTALKMTNGTLFPTSGQVLVEGDELVAEPGIGQFVKRAKFGEELKPAAVAAA